MESTANILKHIKEALKPFGSKKLTDQQAEEVKKQMRWLKEVGKQVHEVVMVDIWTWEKFTAEEKGAYLSLLTELYPIDPEKEIDVSWFPKLQNLEDLFITAIDPANAPKYGLYLFGVKYPARKP